MDSVSDQKREYERVRADWLRRRYSVVDSSVTPDLLAHLVSSFDVFRSLPDEVKARFQTYFRQGNLKSHTGWDRKRRESGDKDDKDIFMYNHSLVRDLGARRLFFSGEQRIDNLFQAFEDVYQETLKMTRGFAQVLDAGLEGTPYSGIERQIFGVLPEVYLRLVCYLNQEGEGDYLARPHYDHSLFTFAFSESARGLRIGGEGEGEKEEVVHQPGKAVVFPSLAAKQTLPPEFHDYLGFHDVLKDPHVVPYNDEVVRWAVVAFAWPENKAFTPWREAHPGANYSANDEALDRMQ